MSNPQGKLNVCEDGYMMFFCPGCNSPHAIRGLEGPKQDRAWVWNGSTTSPTFSPSILVTGYTSAMRCHSFVENGHIRFLDDCGHDRKNQTLELPDWDEKKFWGEDKEDPSE